MHTMTLPLISPLSTQSKQVRRLHRLHHCLHHRHHHRLHHHRQHETLDHLGKCDWTCIDLMLLKCARSSFRAGFYHEPSLPLGQGGLVKPDSSRFAVAVNKVRTHQNKRRYQARVSRLNNHHVNLSATAIMCPVWVDTIQAIASGEQMGEDQGGVGFDAFA
ncbi:hypothetical protein G7K_6398-t1 [Saitoella complicata NRRL Y-17804]|uniref:Uncharacterized protein n=1 Tax=Saitoella complicata (strain BCRC 22490 / CBS 7301 / JCM 7358 / NBRC 10748 / NRRL Y-17804) TaxID=698492 RepID=A0A0E9NR31_SAICN|nr:hypothetical protein G7K_6398-t1 [Saitoella complicata NRRL Y-17804]